MGFFEQAVETLGFLREKFNEVTDWWERGVLGKDRTLNSVVEDLRRTPTEDLDKKYALARFFQTPNGKLYTKEDRKKAYDNLLGQNRNKRTFG